ncbi:phosphotransferase enzyme family protein [Streptomyces sp. NPDC059651]|uniref:phosphotransferase enzyme family protein n=1 Tax=Streptomyces sp. NPDC059651 TaxID=3346897 RepID=UPI0036C88BC9
MHSCTNPPRYPAGHHYALVHPRPRRSLRVAVLPAFPHRATRPTRRPDPVRSEHSLRTRRHGRADGRPAVRGQRRMARYPARQGLLLISPAFQEGASADRGRIHGDLHRENMIAMPDGHIGVIDDCGTGHYLLDIATMLSSVHRIERKQPGHYEEFAQAFLAGYAQVRPLPADFVRLLEPYLLLRDVFVLDFVTGAVLLNEAVANTWGPGRIAGIVANMQSYLEGPPTRALSPPSTPEQGSRRWLMRQGWLSLCR